MCCLCPTSALHLLLRPLGLGPPSGSPAQGGSCGAPVFGQLALALGGAEERGGGSPGGRCAEPAARLGAGAGGRGCFPGIVPKT